MRVRPATEWAVEAMLAYYATVLRAPRNPVLWWEWFLAALHFDQLVLAAIAWTSVYRLAVRFFFPFFVPDSVWSAPPADLLTTLAGAVPPATPLHAPLSRPVLAHVWAAAERLRGHPRFAPVLAQVTSAVGGLGGHPAAPASPVAVGTEHAAVAAAVAGGGKLSAVFTLAMADVEAAAVVTWPVGSRAHTAMGTIVHELLVTLNSMEHEATSAGAEDDPMDARHL
jgi:hypothetical protein